MGFPSPAMDYVEERVDMASIFCLNRNSTYMILCGGNYPDVGILKGSMMAVDSSITPEHGHIVVATIGGEFVMRRLIKRPYLALQELDGARNIDRITDSHELSLDDSPVWGVVAYVVTDAAGFGFKAINE
jgi:SOS-response transcriptional repressors (RecA-mediated autopeptidases)